MRRSPNLIGSKPQLFPLGDNGGSTWTEAVLAVSPVVNAGNLAGCRDGADLLIQTDQRGFRRWDRCDIGAFEFQPDLLFLPPVRR